MSYILPDEVENNHSEFVTIKRSLKKRKYVDETESPKTPFHKLRQQLRLTRSEWCNICNMNVSALLKIENGENLPSIPTAKRIQEEAWRRGIAVTLDELFQNVQSR